MNRPISRNKKGISLVELIAVMAISVVVVGAAITVLYGSSRSTYDGAADYGNHSDAQMLETWFRSNLPTAKSLTATQNRVPHGVTGFTLFFTGGTDNYFEIAKDGTSVLQVRGIKSLAVSTANVGQNQTLQYKITAEGGGRTFVLSGGVVLNNIAAAPSADKTLIPKEIVYTRANQGYLAIS